MKYIVFILFTVMTNAAAQLMLKQGMMALGPISFDGVNPIVKLLQIVFSPWVFLGLCTFVISMASHLYVLSKVELSFAYPFLSLAYVAVAIFAYFVFREDLNAWRIAGIGFISSKRTEESICAGLAIRENLYPDPGLADIRAFLDRFWRDDLDHFATHVAERLRGDDPAGGTP